MRVLIAGGGTGGHVFPGIALAEEVVGRHPANDAVFVGTPRGLEAQVVPAAGFPIELIDVKGLKGKGWLQAVRNLWLLPRAFLRSIGILRAWRPDVVVGVGGYASGPLVLAAWLMRAGQHCQQEQRQQPPLQQHAQATARPAGLRGGRGGIGGRGGDVGLRPVPAPARPLQ